MCQHKNFTATVNVFRLAESEDKPEIITGYTADLKIKCAECGLPFEFVGVPGGVNPSFPTVNADNTELRTPIIPSDKPVVKKPGIIYN